MRDTDFLRYLVSGLEADAVDVLRQTVGVRLDPATLSTTVQNPVPYRPPARISSRSCRSSSSKRRGLGFAGNTAGADVVAGGAIMIEISIWEYIRTGLDRTCRVAVDVEESKINGTCQGRAAC